MRGGLPGDRVRARVTKTKRGFAEAIAEAVLEPSPERVEAPCRHFGVCGGCRFQDLGYDAQIAAKEQQVRDALTRIGRFADPPLEPIVPAVAQFGYRTSSSTRSRKARTASTSASTEPGVGTRLSGSRSAS